jgi:endoglucanase
MRFVFLLFCSFIHAGQFWDIQRKGTNIFNQELGRSTIEKAKTLGVGYVRLALDKFLSQQRDFLIGNADKYCELVPEDLAQLKAVLDVFRELEMPVVLVMLSLPGSRWKQNNIDPDGNEQDDLRIWESEEYQDQAAQFWKDLAIELLEYRDIIVGYNLLNEPHPERLTDKQSTSMATTMEIQQLLYNFYAKVIEAIRSVDQTTYIILDSSCYADPQAFGLFMPHDDPRILYAFHMGEPYKYTCWRLHKNALKYPGFIDGKWWDKQALIDYMSPVIEFQKRHGIPCNRIIAAEFGCDQRCPGAEKFLKDLMEHLQDMGCHFGFYGWGPDSGWVGRDYERNPETLAVLKAVYSPTSSENSKLLPKEV